MFLGKRIRQKRIDHEYTQEELGNMIGVSKATICNWEKGVKNPSSKNLIELSKALNTDVEYLIGSDIYAVSNSDDRYGIMLANEEIEVIRELRKHKKLHESLCDSPKRTIDRIDKNLFE